MKKGDAPFPQLSIDFLERVSNAYNPMWGIDIPRI